MADLSIIEVTIRDYPEPHEFARVLTDKYLSASEDERTKIAMSLIMEMAVSVAVHKHNMQEAQP